MVVATKTSPDAVRQCNQYQQQAAGLQKTLEGQKSIPLDSWIIYQGIYQDLSKGTEILTKASQETLGKDKDLGKIAIAFSSSMAQIGRRLHDLRPISIEDCFTLNEKATGLKEELLTLLQELKPGYHDQYAFFKGSLDTLKSEASEIYRENTPFYTQKVTFNTHVAHIEERLKRITPVVISKPSPSLLSSTVSYASGLTSSVASTASSAFSNTVQYFKGKTASEEPKSEYKPPAQDKVEEKSAFDFINK